MHPVTPELVAQQRPKMTSLNIKWENDSHGVRQPTK
jgi:hypothetical protein